MENNSKYDKENSKLVVVMYHKNNWHNKALQNFTNRMTYFTKFASEKEDFYFDQLGNELKRITKLFASRLFGDYADNPITTCLVYSNDNKGDIKKGSNRELFKIVINKGVITDAPIMVKDAAFRLKIEDIIDQVENLLQQVLTAK